MTNEEKQEIIEAVLEALQTNSKSISQLTAATGLLDGDLIEIAGGKRITFANLAKNVMAKGVVNDLTTGGEADALSAEQGKVLKGLIDNIGTGSIAAFTDYAVAESVSALPATGVATTGYIVGNHIYAYVGEGGDTRDGKYQDLGALEAAGVSVTTAEDGTFTIHAGGNDYTVNLNHTHPNMCKLVVCEESDLPSTLEEDTIYGVEEDGEISVLYVGGIPFYGGGGGPVSGPTIRRPADGSTVNIGNTVSGSVSNTINVKGKNLTQALTVELDGTGYSFGTTQPTGVTRVSGTELTVTAAAANALNGVDIAIDCTGSDSTENIEGTLSITSSENISVECTLFANYVAYETLTAVKFTRQQYVNTGFLVGANTRIELDMQFSGDLPASIDDNTQVAYFLGAKSAGSPSQYVACNVGAKIQSQIVSDNQSTIFWVGKDTSLVPRIDFTEYSTFFNRSWMKINNVTKKAEFQSLETAIVGMTINTGGNLVVGANGSGSKLFACYDIILYELKHYESSTLTHDYIPKKRNGVVGLYDTVTGNFISSSTNVSLEAII